MSNNVTNDSETTVQERLAQIAAAVAAKTTSDTGGQDAKPKTSMACPIDPAERALCDSCQ
jgi:hypothetical protein